MIDSRHPFGPPDGSTADLKELVDGFIAFGDEVRFGSLAFGRMHELRARVFVGRKGSGKTVYLRKLRDAIRERSGVYSSDVERDVPSTYAVKQFSHAQKSNELTDTWSRVWRKAIFRSLISCFMDCENKLSYYMSDKISDQVQHRFRDIIPNTKKQVTIYSQVLDIITKFPDSHSINRYINNSLWAELETLISELIKDSPPICFFIDAVDEEMKHAPMEWHRCQKGLFYEIFHLMQDERFSPRLHVFIAVRDIVYTSVLQGEHGRRYRETPYIRQLNWSKGALSYFFQKKMEKIDNDFVFNAGTWPRNFSEWFGMSRIKNKDRNKMEDTDRYILRHTRLLPRDVVILGNAFASIVGQNRIEGKTSLTGNIVRNVVKVEARQFCEEQLEICSNHLATLFIPRYAVAQGYDEFYTGSSDYIRSISDELVKVIRLIGRDRFGGDEAQIAREIFGMELGGEPDVFSVLWQHGLIGVVDRTFNSETILSTLDGYTSDFRLPRGECDYVFHPSVIDYAGIKPVGNNPVEFWGVDYQK